ncbi:MAG: UDP-N-acetylglucosamine 2-epimerase (non-hydrolyzing) [Verrucomicrobiales bacterium]|nr:UDP-N-acetylglucosamine 2-epimerase (non-hydrolyzing) [Verrucomicrobiales bacterium]
MQTVVSIVGTRPEGIKMAPVVQELGRHPDRLRSVLVSTGQHREMLDQVLRLFGLRPNVELNLMRPDQTLARLTGDLFHALDAVVREQRPDWILAQGDTTTVMVASVVAFYHRIRFGHVEAGLRTGDYQRPFPEELNRRIADLAASAYFAPTARSAAALRAEGIPDGAIHETGNTVVDALLQVAARPFDWASSPLSVVPEGTPFVLVTAHRRESFGEPFRELCRAILEVAESGEAQGIRVVFPVHLNPNVRAPVREILGGHPRVHLLEPLDYVDMVQALRRARLILTDSGGVQEEAPSFGVPVLVMRDTTERPEGVEAGAVHLVGTDRSRIVASARAHLSGPVPSGAARNPYGDGHAAERIVSVLLREAAE